MCQGLSILKIVCRTVLLIFINKKLYHINIKKYKIVQEVVVKHVINLIVR